MPRIKYIKPKLYNGEIVRIRESGENVMIVRDQLDRWDFDKESTRNIVCIVFCPDGNGFFTEQTKYVSDLERGIIYL